MSNQNWNSTTPDPGQDPNQSVPGYQPPQSGEPDAPQGYQPPAAPAEGAEVPPAYQPPASAYEPPATYPPTSAPYGQPPATPYGQPSADYGQPAPGGYPPASPYGQPPAPYGQPPAGGYPPVPYGQPTDYPAAGYGVGNYPVPTAGVPLADWGKRALGAVIDYGPISVLSWIGNGIAANISGGGFVTFIFWLAGMAWLVWNTGYKAGTTGVSFGRSIAGTKLVAEATGQPVGVGLAIVRYIAHFIDSILCMIGWFMPLWDSKRQTIADKVMKTVVLDTSADPNPTKFEWK